MAAAGAQRTPLSRVPYSAGAMGRFALLALFLLAGACESQKQPAQTLIDEIDLTIAGSAEDAAKYAPAQLREVEDELGALKRSFAQQDYAGVLSRGPSVLSAAGELIGTAAAAKGDRSRALAGEWAVLAEALPDRMSALEKRIERLDKRPGDAAAARAALKESYALWSKARSAFASRNLEEAVRTGSEVKQKIDALSDTLGPSVR